MGVRNLVCQAMLAVVAVCEGQDNALVLLRAGNPGGACSGAKLEPQLVTIRNYKINGKDEVRLSTTEGRATPSTAVSREEFNRMRKVKLRDLSQLEVANGLMYVSTGDGARNLAIPDMEPQRGASVSMGQYIEMALEGESREGRSNQKQRFPLRTIWRMFVLTPTVSVDEALFRHARQEASIGAWKFYLVKVTSYRSDEATEALTSVTSGCLAQAMNRFRAGEFSAIEEAKEFGRQQAAMTGNSGPAAEQLAAIEKEERDAADRIRAGTQLMRDKKWDDALLVWEPLRKYLKDPTLKEFGANYSVTNQSSHDLHVETAEKSVPDVRLLVLPKGSDAPYHESLKHYEIALTRLPNSELARAGRKEMLIRIGLVEAANHRQLKEPSKANAVLAGLVKDVGDDARLSAELREANCEWGAQLFSRARDLVTLSVVVAAKKAPVAPQTKKGAAGAKGAPIPKASPKPEPESPAAAPSAFRVKTIQSQSDKKPFEEAREGLLSAMNLCPAEDKIQLLAGVNAALSDYHVAHAKRATQRKLFATALLHLQAAHAYQPERTDLEGPLAEAREPVQRKAQIQAGVVIRALNAQCAEAAQQVAGAVESALVGAGTANIQLLSQGEAQNALTRIRSTAGIGHGMSYAIVSGQISVCMVTPTAQRRPVTSQFQTPNPDHARLQEYENNASRAFNDCKNANGEPACLGYKNQRDQARRNLSNSQAYFLTNYQYEEVSHLATGQMKLTLQIDDSILRGTRPVGEASGSLNEPCLERRGVRPDDVGRPREGTSSKGILSGLLSALGPREQVTDSSCPQFHLGSKLQQIADQVQKQAQNQAGTAVRDVAKGYFELARRATDPEIALENYITFALLNDQKTGSEYQQAVTMIRARDTDLRPETALR